MSEFQTLPTFQFSNTENPLALFLADLRTWVFSSQARAASYFGLDRSTIWRYEEGRTLPPPAYLAELAYLVAERLGSQQYGGTTYRQLLLQEINRAIIACYPNEQPFNSWKDAVRSAQTYYATRRIPPATPISEHRRQGRAAGRRDLAAARIDWGDAPDVAVLYGRQQELTTLHQTLAAGQCRVLGIFGMGGVGKTVLTARLVETLTDTFEYVFWRSLVNAPPPAMLIREFLHLLIDPGAALPDAEQMQLRELLPHLQSQRCLIVLDNFETILDNQQRCGDYRAGYEAYGQLLRLFGAARHQSCLVLTSREKPREMAVLENAVANAGRVQSYRVPGLAVEDADELLHDIGLEIDQQDVPALLQRCSGNPKILEIVASVIRDLFDGSAAAFLAQESIMFDDVRDILQAQFDRLTPAEQEVMFWLALAREHLSIGELRQLLIGGDSGDRLLHTVRALQRRCLIETDVRTLYLQNAVAEYIIDVLFQRLHSELLNGQFFLLHRCALIRAQAKDYVRASQERVLLRPLADRLLQQYSRTELAAHIDALLARLRQEYAHRPSYAGGNVLNLLVQLGIDPAGRDFSQLALRQAYLKGVTLHQVNFAGADLHDAVFSETFGSVRTVAFSPDGHVLAAGSSNGEIHVWEAHSRQHLYTLDGYAWVEALAFSANNWLLASGSHEPAIQLWDMRSGTWLGQLEGHTTTVRTLGFSADGSTLASGSDDSSVLLWDVQQRRQRACLRGHRASVWSVVFHPSAPLLVSAGSDEILLWDLASATVLQRLEAHQAAVMTVALSPDGRTLASGSYDGCIKLWSLPDVSCYATLKHHSNAVRALAFSPDGALLASGSEDQSIRLWNPLDGQARDIIVDRANRVRALAFSPDGNVLASGSHDQNVRLWHVASRQCVTMFQGYINQLRTLALSPDGCSLALGVAERIYLMDTESGNIVRQLHGHSEWVQSLAFNRAGTLLASSSDDHSVRLWPLQGAGNALTLNGHLSWVQAVAFSPDGQTVATCSIDRSIRLWNASSGQCRHVLYGHNHHIWTLAISPDGRWLASGSADTSIRLWDMQSGECRHVLNGHAGSVWSLEFTNDAAWLVSSGHDRLIRIWDVQEARLLGSLSGHNNRVVSVALSPDGNLIASGGDDRSLRIWDLRSGTCGQVLSGHQRPVVAVAFSPDGRLVYSGSEDGTVRVWDVHGGECVRVLTVPRPYDGMNISGATGLTQARRASLMALGAIDQEPCVALSEG